MNGEIQNNEGQINVVEEEPKIIEESKVEEENKQLVVAEMPESKAIEAEMSEPKTETIDESSIMGETTVDVIPIVQEPPDSQPMDLDNFPIEDLPTESNLIEQTDLTKDKEMVLVPVKGNPKVMRCTACNTFVSRERPHTMDECASNRRKRDACRGKKRRCNTKKCIARKGKTLAKKYCKKRSKLPKEVKAFLEKFLC